jgi:hypothetical protein
LNEYFVCVKEILDCLMLQGVQKERLGFLVDVFAKVIDFGQKI